MKCLSCETKAINSDSKILDEFVKYAKASSGKQDFGTIGVDGIALMAAHYMSREFDLAMPHVPCEGIGLTYIDLMAGRRQMAFRQEYQRASFTRRIH